MMRTLFSFLGSIFMQYPFLAQVIQTGQATIISSYHL